MSLSNDPIILSNTCVGHDVWKKMFNKQYNNPFITTLIPNDLDFIKLCNNIHHYISCRPILGEPRSDSLFAKQNLGQWYKHGAIKIPYPVIFLDDIEIHCIHEDNNQTCLDTFMRRLERMREIVSSNENCKILGILTFSELINDHEDIQSIIDMYLSNKNNIFAGPTRYKHTDNSNYIIVNDFDYVGLHRNNSHMYVFNNQPLATDIFINHIHKFYA